MLFHKFRQKRKQWHNKGNTELYCLIVAADNIVDAISFTKHTVLWFETKFSQIHKFLHEFLNPARSGSSRIWNSPIRYNPIEDKLLVY